MKAKHIFLIVILFFCGVSLNAQNQALAFLKAEPHDGNPTVEETIDWLNKNWNLKILHSEGFSGYACVKSGLYNKIFNLDKNYNILNMHYDLCCGAISACECCRTDIDICLLYTSPSPRDGLLYRMPSSA